MAMIVAALIKVFKKPTVGGVVLELALFVAPLWAAAVVGLLIGWAWRPRWAAGLVGGGRRMPSPQPSESFLSGPINNLVSFYRSSAEQGEMVDDDLVVPGSESLAVAEDDLEHLCQLVEMRDGGPAWHLMMDKSLPTFSYQAWRRDPQSGPSQYRSRTVFEDATPDMVRDFFWDDEFRIKNKWDDMLLQHVTLEECPATGTMVVHWIRKFPFFCSDRDYTIGRRIWESGRTYYCVTKGVPCPSVPRHNKPRRVDLYYSSWCIRAVESRRGDGQLTACEVILFHHEDMGIPQEIAKLGIRQGMWRCVKKIEPGLRAYQMARMSGEPLSRCALMAQINTKVSPDYLMPFQINGSSSDIIEAEKEKHSGFNIPKFLVIGGAVALACTLDRGLITKAVIFGVARRFANFGKRF